METATTVKTTGSVLGSGNVLIRKMFAQAMDLSVLQIREIQKQFVKILHGENKAVPLLVKSGVKEFVQDSV